MQQAQTSSVFTFAGSHTYNTLLDVVHASEQLRRRQAAFEALHREVSLDADRCGAPAGLGVFLLHRHWTLGPADRMVERAGSFRGEPALISASEPIGARAAPSRWLVEGSQLRAVEYSMDPIVAAVSLALSRCPEFLSLFTQALGDHGLRSHCGLAIANRSFLPAGPGEFHLEFDGGEQSIVVCRSETERDGNAIETVWPLLRVPVAGCESDCDVTSSTRCRATKEGHVQVHDFDHKKSHTVTPICQPTGCV